MPLKTRGILVVVIGLIMGLSLSLGGGLLSTPPAADPGELAGEQVVLFAVDLERVWGG